MPSTRVLIVGMLFAAALWPPIAAASLEGEQAVPGEPGAMLLELPSSFALLDSARNALYAYRMTEAEQLLRRLQTRADGRPAALYHLTLAALHRALMSDADAQFATFQARSDSLADLLARAEVSPWRDGMEADRRLWEAAAHLKEGRYVRGAWAARAAYRAYDRVVDAFPSFYESYTGLGLLHLAIGSMPRSYRFILNVLGYDGGIRMGIEELQTAHGHARYSQVEAGVYLAVAQEMLYLDEEEGLRIATALRRMHPESPLLAHVHGFMLIATRQAKAGAETLREAIERSEQSPRFYVDYLDYFLADALFKLNDFEGAERYYRRYIDRHQGPALKAMAHLRLGLAMEMQGRRSEAVAAYEEVRAARTFDTDEMARREAESLAARPVSGVDRMLLLAANAFDSGRLEESIELLTDVQEESGLTDDQAAERAYRFARIYHVRGALDQAIATYERAEALRGDALSRFAPWSAFFIGKIRLRQGRTADADAAFDRALSYEGQYDFYQALEQGVRAAREMAEQEGP